MFMIGLHHLIMEEFIFSNLDS